MTFSLPVIKDGQKSTEVIAVDMSAFDDDVKALIERLHCAIVTQQIQNGATNRRLSDITLKMDAATQALAESEQRYRKVVDLSPSAVLILSGKAMIAVNQAACRMLGLDDSEPLISKSALEIFTPECRSDIEKLIELGNVAEGIKKVQRLIHANGSEVVVEVYVAKYDASTCYMILRDITRQQTAEDELRISEERSLFALEASGIGVWDWYPDTNASFFSPAWKKMIGYEDHEISSVHEEWTSRVHPDDWPSIFEAERRLFRGETDIYECIYRLRAKDGNYKWVLSRGKPVAYGPEGTPSRYIGTHTDLTERLEAEAKIEGLNRDLSARNAELEIANHELETFSYTVSHDLRSPLRTIDGYSHAIEYDYADDIPEGAKEYLRSIRRATQRLGRLIDDILSLSRINQSPIRRQSVNIGSIAKEITQEIAALYSDRKFQFVIDAGMTAEGDRSLLRIALQNLIGNAAKFSAQTAVSQIHIGKQDDAFFVKDNGVGFNMQHANKLFEPFQRLHANDEFEGSGIGLATVARIVRRHGGRIWAESELGKGTTLYFTLAESGR